MYTGRCFLSLISFMLFLSRIPAGYGARILCIFQMPSISHHATFQPITRELSLRGHEVISVTSVPIKDPSLTNLTEIDISNVMEIFQKYDAVKFMSIETTVQSKIWNLYFLHEEIAEIVYENEKFKKIYTDPNQKFDLIILQIYTSPIFYPLSYKLKAPFITISSMGVWNGAHVAIGNPNPPALYSEMYVPYNGDLTFYERIKSTLYFLWTRVFLYFIGIPRCDAIARKYLGDDLPYLTEVEKNVSAILLNINPLMYPPRPMVPTMVPLSFIHVRPPKPLPEDIKKELDSAKNGVVYFSLGSNVQSVGLPLRLRNIIVEAIAELPYKVLWKFEGDDLPNKPKNVVIRKWLPQQDILAHPNVKVFLCQGGLQSTEEAVDREVPIVGIPFISDQELDLRALSRWGVAKWIHYSNTTKEELVKAIIEVAETPIYRENMKKFKQLFQDQPETGLQRAIWWAEYVIRHKGTPHLRSPYADIEWYKFLLLDVFAVLLGSLLLVTFIIVKIVKLLLSANINNITNKKAKTKKH